MIISKCALRISLVGGSTDLEEFVQNNGYGSVISFPCNLHTYISIFSDKNGFNHKGKYIINYRKREEVDFIEEINNDIAREVFNYFSCPPINASFNADIFSEGSGLASSSSYLISMIKAVSEYKKVALNEFDICSIALKLERKFNPLTGYQDIYGCGLSGFKRLHFKKDGIKVDFLDPLFLNKFNMSLIYTGVKRSSTDVLKSVDLKKIEKLLPLVDEMESAIRRGDGSRFLEIIGDGWAKKKETSPLLTQDERVKAIDVELSQIEEVLAHKLCGAGNGGYFLAFTAKEFDLKERLRGRVVNISISNKALQTISL